jgi:hypothetical protein
LFDKYLTYDKFLAMEELMRNYGLSDQVRAVARDKYVVPALRSGRTAFSIRVRNLLDDLAQLGFPANSTPLVCNALRSSRFLGEDLEITEVEGPPSKMSTTVVMHYRITDRSMGGRPKGKEIKLDAVHVQEDAKARAKRLAEGLKGLLREELSEYGGGEAFLRWVRSEGEEAA